MSPLEVAARFAAFAWYTEAMAPGLATEEEARRIARENWEAFLPVATEGLGRLLIRLARLPSRKPHGSRKRCAASAC
jgi:hypothetical protein